MKKFTATVFYTTSKWKEVTIVASNEWEAQRKIDEWVMDEDTSNWSDCDDASVTVGIESVEEVAHEKA